MKRELMVMVLFAAVGACTTTADRDATSARTSETRNAKPATESPEQQVIVIPLEPPGGDVFLKLDGDGDGYLSRQEAINNDLAKNFDRYDVNRDGRISADEYDQFATTPAGATPPAGSRQSGESQQWDTRTY